MNSTIIANWLFLTGSAVFTLDAVITTIESLSIHSVFQISACLAFSLGCVLLLQDAYRQQALSSIRSDGDRAKPIFRRVCRLY